MLKFVGDSHKEALREILSFLDSADDRVYMLCGEPGIGKSRVLDEFMQSKVFDNDRFAKKFIIYRDDSVDSLLISWLDDLLSKVFLFKGNKERWKSIIGTIPQFGPTLAQFIKDDPRPAKQKFLDALNLLSEKMNADERLVIVIDPFVDLKTHENAEVLLHFASESPAKVKFVIAQRTSDLLANDPNFVDLAGKNKFDLKRLQNEDVEEIICADPQLCKIGKDKCKEFEGKVGGWPLALDRYSQEIKQSDETADDVVERLPAKLETDVKNNYEELDKQDSRVAELLSLLGETVDFKTLTALSKLDEDDLSQSLKSKTLGNLIESTTQDDKQTFRMRHALYAQWIVDLLKKRIDVPERYREIAAFFLERFGDDYRHAQDLVRYVRYLYAADDDKNFLEETGGVCQDMYRLALYDSLLDLEEKRLAIARKLGDAKSEASALNNIGEVYRAWGQYDEAISYSKQTLEVTEKAFGSEHPNFAACLNNLAGLYDNQGKYGEAEPLYKRALEISETALGSDHPTVAIRLNNLAGLYDSLGKYDDAEPLYKRALEIVEKSLGSEHPYVAASLNNLAGLYDSQGKYDEAEPLYKRALAIGEKTLGPNHPNVAIRLNNLAGLYRTQGKYDEAEPLYKRALAIDEKALGPDHPNVAIRLNNLALLFRAQGKYDEAEPLYKRALKIFEAAFGSEHPNVAASLNNLALLYYSQGKYNEAEPLYERAIEIDEKALGPDHPGLATDLNNLAGLYDAQGKYGQAEPLYKRALKIFEAAFGSEHPHVKTCKKNLEILRERMKEEG